MGGYFKGMNANTKKQPPKRVAKPHALKKSKRAAQKTSTFRKLDVIERKYGPDFGLNKPEQLEQFYRRLERDGQKSLVDLIRPE